MINQTFSGTLKKYEPVRTIDGDIFIKILIKHSNHGGVQTFLNDFSKKLSLDLEPLFVFPVRWDKISFSTKDYGRKTYNITFESETFTANLDKISISRKLIDGTDIFDYSMEYSKEPSIDILDKLMVEAYLNYKEEDENGKKHVVEYAIRTELLERVQQGQLDTSIF